MTAIKHTLQRQVFLPSEERLIAVVHVTKAGKKKKASFLCAAVTTEKPIQAYIYQVKKSDKGDNNFKKKLQWTLRELKFIDGKNASKDTADFDMQFDKLYKWTASSIADKLSFIENLWKLSHRYLVQKPEFLNVPPGVLEELYQSSETEKSGQQAEAEGLDTDSDYHALSAREEQDLEMLMSQSEDAISNAEAFAEKLARDLSMLDGANIHSIMGSEDQVLELMVQIDEALHEAYKLEEKLDDYDHKLQSIKDLMDVMREKDTLLQVRNKNHQQLLDELDTIVVNMDLEHTHMKALLDGDLTRREGITACAVAARALHKAMSVQIHPALQKMAAVQEQKKKFIKLKTNFAKRVSHQMNNLFIHQGNDMGEAVTRQSGETRLPPHAASQRDLLPYAELMLWLKQADTDSYKKLCKVYTTSLSKLYDREIKEFFEAAKQKIAPQRLERKGSSLRGKVDVVRGTVDLGLDRLSKLGTLPSFQSHVHSGSTTSLNKPPEPRSSRSPSQSTIDAMSIHGSEQDIIGRQKFDQALEHVLSELGPWCLAEQDFCVRFFHLTSEKDEHDKSEKSEDRGEADGPWVQKKKERQINEDVRQMMRDLFPSLESELNNFIGFGDRMDSFNSLYMLVRMSEHVINAEDTGSFLSKTFASCLVIIKRNFDKFVQMQVDNVSDYKLSKKGKVGIISFVHNFEEFANQAECIFKGSERRNDLDKAYQRLMEAIFKEVNRVAFESQKIPTDVVKMENFHHLYDVLSQLKIASLENQRKEARQRYQEHLQAYVSSSLGRPMEKLSVFFDGIEAKIAQGVKAEEVGYQLAYNKQELRKVIKEYPGKEVKKNLEHLYRKVEKILCEEEHLQEVVWHSMQDEFLKQYKHFEDLIAKCYKDSGISLDFTISDLLGYFSDIAQSH